MWWYQKHFLWTMEAPLSLYSAFVIHMVWKVDRDDKIDPPIQTKNFLSWGATTLTFMVEGAKAVTYLLNLSGMPGNIVVPPLMTMLLYKSFLMSTSHLRMDWYVISWKPGIYLPMTIGLKRASGHLNLWLPIVTVWPSGSS